MSMAIKYGLMKRAQKANACEEHGMQGCEMCHGGMMAEGGEAKKKPEALGKTQSGKDFYQHHADPRHAGFSKQDHLDAMEHHVNAQGPLEHKSREIERKKMGSGHGGYDHSGQVNAIDKMKHHKRMAQAHSDAADDASDDAPEEFAEGGMVGDDDDMVGRIMRSRKGEPEADFEMNDFDAMDETAPGNEADYTGADSGDEVGDAQEDEDQRDIVSRIMRSRSKKDRMPRPA